MWTKLQAHFHYTTATILAIIAAAITLATTLGLHVSPNVRTGILQLAGLILGGIVVGGGVKSAGLLNAGLHPLQKTRAKEMGEAIQGYVNRTLPGEDSPIKTALPVEPTEPEPPRPLHPRRRPTAADTAHPILQAHGTFAGLRLGKRPPVLDARTPVLGEFLDAKLGVRLPHQTEWLPPIEDALGNDFGMMGNDTYGDCVTPETKILTRDLRWIEAGDLQVGDDLLAFDEDSRLRGDRKTGRWFIPAIVQSVERVTRPCYELEFEDGTTVRCSAGHRWLTKSTVQGELGCQRWEKTEDLRVESPRQTSVCKPLETWKVDESWNAGYLAAAFDGEGHLEQVSRANRVAFNQTENAMLAQVGASLEEAGYDYNHEIHARNHTLRADGSPRKTMNTLRIGQRAEFLRFMGSVRPRRLLEAYDVRSLGRIPSEAMSLVRKTFIGDQEVIRLDTTSRTYFAEGMASHNCTCAALGHAIQLWTGVEGAPVTLTAAQILDLYWKTGTADDGRDMFEVLKYVAQNGLAGHQFGAYVSVGLRRYAHRDVKAAIDLFGGCYLGVELPETAQTQSVWDVVGDPSKPGPAQADSWGGHAIWLGDYDHEGPTCITWSHPLKMTWKFLNAYADEGYAVISPDWFKAGKTIEGFDVAALTAYLNAIKSGA